PVAPELRIVLIWRQYQRRTAAPPAHHFGSQELLLLRRRGLGSQVAAKGGHVHVELAERHERAVLAQLLRDWGLGGLSVLVGVAQDELASLDRRFTTRLRN